MADNFQEDQNFSQRWLLFLELFLWGAFLILSLLLLLQKKVEPVVACLPFLFITVFLFFMRSLRLQTRITADSISYRLFPVQRRFRVIKKSEITELEVKSYEPIREYGGWGIRFGKNGMAYTARGNKGIYIGFGSRKHILIGTSRPAEVEQFL
ncbi:MAG TPA: hypothetical protein VL978_08785, partial [Puia sp.]|nr:hypothetical protein [Puia sp.]